MNLVVDLDGTLAHWGSGGDLGVGAWMPGALEACRTLRAAGHKIVVHSCRATWVAGGGVAAIAAFLRSGEFEPFAVSAVDQGGYQVERWYPVLPDGRIVEVMPLPSAVNERGGMVPQVPEDGIGIWFGRGKPIGHWYIDDRGVTFDPDLGWAGMLQTLAVRGVTLAALGAVT